MYSEYLRRGKPKGLTYKQYLEVVGFSNPAANINGMDDSLTRAVHVHGGPEFISVPNKPITGNVHVIVLLVDFDDQQGTRDAATYHDLLFSRDAYPTGSMRDYYREVSSGNVDVVGHVHGWLRLPQSYDFYTNNNSGTGAYPRNAQKMAEDAVQVAVAAGIAFPQELDALGAGIVTALFIIHAGRGAEELDASIRSKHVWSHKWDLPNPVKVRANPDLFASKYLTVPHDCNMGVCAHELGHLLFQWEDFYDIDRSNNGQWSGSGDWDLMAGGSWNGNRGDTPAHPVGLHKLQHGWVPVETITASKVGVQLPPYSSTGRKVVKVIADGSAFTPNQFLLLENRQQVGFDRALPGSGLLVWRVDLEQEQHGPARPALQLVQADGRADLESSTAANQGDAGDPFPGATGTTSVGDGAAPLTTTFPLRPSSGVTLKNISVNTQGVVMLDIDIRPATVVNAGAVVSTPPPPLGTPSLQALMQQSKVTVAELKPFMQQVTPTLVDIEQQLLTIPQRRDYADFLKLEKKVEKKEKRKRKEKKPSKGPSVPAAVTGLFGSSAADDFGGRAWRMYKWAFGITWDVQGRFFGTLTFDLFTQVAKRDYIYTPHPTDPFGFERHNGEVIIPGKMTTDGGSVPRPAWVIDDINPWTYIKAFLVHDWEFLNHHCTSSFSKSFTDANETLAEGIYTLMVTQDSPEIDADWRKVALVNTAVSSPVGWYVWSRSWADDECSTAQLPRS